MAAAVAAFACPAPAAAATGRPLAGVWEATLPDGFVRFTVAGGTVRGTVVAHRCRGGGTAWSEFAALRISPAGAVRLVAFTKIEGVFATRRLFRGVVNPDPGIGTCRARFDRRFTARPLPRAPLAPRPGRWQGPAGAGVIAFTVTAKGRVTDVQLSGSTACFTRAAPTPFAADAVVRPSTAAFVARDRPVTTAGAPAGFSSDLTGRFGSAASATGTLREATAGTRPCDTGPIAWSAAPVTSPA